MTDSIVVEAGSREAAMLGTMRGEAWWHDGLTGDGSGLHDITFIIANRPDLMSGWYALPRIRPGDLVEWTRGKAWGVAPWEASHGDQHWVIIAEGIQQQLLTDGLSDDAEDVANAALIAAAPRLLSALRFVLAETRLTEDEGHALMTIRRHSTRDADSIANPGDSRGEARYERGRLLAIIDRLTRRAP